MIALMWCFNSNQFWLGYLGKHIQNLFFRCNDSNCRWLSYLLILKRVTYHNILLLALQMAHKPVQIVFQTHNNLSDVFLEFAAETLGYVLNIISLTEKPHQLAQHEFCDPARHQSASG